MTGFYSFVKPFSAVSSLLKIIEGLFSWRNFQYVTVHWPSGRERRRQDDDIVDLLLASMSLSRGAVSEEDSCSLTLAMSLGCR